MRSIFAAAAVAMFAVVGPAWGDCTSHLMPDSTQTYTSALLKRMRPLGVKDIDRVGPSSSGDHYAVLGAQFSLFLKTDSARLKEIGLVLSEPSSRADNEKLLTAAAFTLARLSGTPEAPIRTQLTSDFAAHDSGSWNETFGPAAAVFVRSPDGTVVKAGLLSCD